jgi:translocation and assembly module TamB
VTEPTETGEKHGRPWWRWLLWIIVAVLLLPVMIVLLLQLTAVQDYLRRQGEAYLQKKLHTTVRIGYLHARGWQYLELRNVYVADTSHQALFYTGSLKVRYNLLAFLNNELSINKLEWDTLMVNIYRHKGDSTFNYQFIADAFGSKEATPDTLVPATGTTLQYKIKDIALRQVKVRYIDNPGGMTAVLTWNELQVDPDDLLVDDGVYSFRGIKLDGLKGLLQQQYIPKVLTAAAPPPPPVDTNGTSLHLLLKQLLITNSSFVYADEGSGLSTAWKIGELKLRNSSLDQDSTRIQIGDLSIKNTGGLLTLLPAKDTTTPPPDSTPNTWQVFATRVTMDKMAMQYDNGAPPPKAAGPDPDYNHLFLTGFSTNVGTIRYTPDSISAIIHSLKAKDKSGFAIRKANMKFLFTPKSLALDNFLIQTNQSILRRQISVSVPSWSTLSQNMDLLQINANIDSTHIALGEWLPFVPDARKNKSFAPLWHKQLDLAAILKGSLGQLKIEQLRITDNDGNLLETKGEIAHVTDVDRLQANLPSLLLQSGNKPLRSWLPPHTLPDTPRLPEHMLITGSFIGGMKDLKTELQLKSETANANVSAHLINITDSLHSKYDINISSFRVQPGILLYDTTFGWISGHMNAQGQGYSVPHMLAKATIQLDQATYNGYTYHDVNVAGNINQGLFEAIGESADTSITADFNIKGHLVDTTIKDLQVNLHLTKADLYATNWYTQPLMLKGNLKADFASLEPQRLEGRAWLTDWQIAANGQVVPVDSVLLIAHMDDQQYLSILGPFGYIKAQGHIDYTKIGSAFTQLIKKPLEPIDSSRIIQLPPGQELQWTAALTWPRNLESFMHGLRMEKPLLLDGRLNSDSSLLVFNASLPKLNYDSLQVDSLQIHANILDTTLKASISLASLKHQVLPLYHTELLAKATAGLVDWDLVMEDVKHLPKYKVGGLLRFLPENVMELSLKPDLLLNKLKWSVADNNLVRIKNGAPDTANLKISNGAQSIQLATLADTSATTPALQAYIKDFQLSTITGMLAADTLLANGILNADATVRHWDTSPLINSNLKVDSLVVQDMPMGTFTAHVATPEPNQYKLEATLTDQGNDLKIAGTYDSTINAQVDIGRLNMVSLQPFTFGNITRMHGFADGQFTISGTSDRPRIEGNLHFNKAGGTVTYLGNDLTLPDETIIIDKKGIQMDKLVITDSLNNELVVNGRINTNNYKNYNFMLDVNADNFMVLGKQQNPDQWIYGPAFIDSKVKIRGTLDLPRVDANVKLVDKSNITVMLPDEAPGLADREGVVEFINLKNPIDSNLLKNVDSSKYQNPRLKGIIFSGIAEVTPASTIKIIIDKQNGDYVEAKGTANINATLDPSSKMSLTGRYEIDGGKYEMSFNQLLKRSFNIVKGSSITFNGEATNADLDITAKYTVQTSAAELVADQISGKSDADRIKYKQRLDFDVYLMIKGNLMKPDISFRLDMPEDDRNALGGAPYNRIKQINMVESELNKQVMGLLILNSFIPEDPMSTLDGGGGGIGYAAKQSVSKILSQQLNNLAGHLIKGVDLNFDLQNKEDYSTGTAQESTSLNVGASKRLFNDRLTVSVGSNIMLQGQQQANATNLIGDISIEYMLSRDGRYRIRVYQRNDNETVVEGQVIETGVAFVLVMDYNNFREILQKAGKTSKKEKLRNNQQKK